MDQGGFILVRPLTFVVFLVSTMSEHQNKPDETTLTHNFRLSVF